jgi:putative membrane protein
MLRYVMTLLLATTPAFAQLGNSAGMTPSTPLSEPGTPAPGHPNNQDRLFVHLMATGGMAEINAAKLADAKAASAPVREFARRMAQDHGAAHQQLVKLARQAGIPVPNRLTPDQEALKARLEPLSGAAFDQAYLQAQLVEHQKTAQILQLEIAMGQDAQLQRHAAAVLPTVMEHLQAMQRLMGQAAGNGPARVAPAG